LHFLIDKNTGAVVTWPGCRIRFYPSKNAVFYLTLSARLLSAVVNAKNLIPLWAGMARCTVVGQLVKMPLLRSRMAGENTVKKLQHLNNFCTLFLWRERKKSSSSIFDNE